jgi:hypothetical protein
MESKQHVSAAGDYLQGPEPTSVNTGGSGSGRGGAPPPTSTVPVTAHGGDGGGGAKKHAASSKGHYITMLKTRVALTNAAAGALAKACTIAARSVTFSVTGLSHLV